MRRCVAFGFLVMLVSSCESYGGASHEEIVKGLSEPSAIVRLNAADAMRHNNSFGSDGVPALIAAANAEVSANALGAELIALGASGSSDAEPLICKYLKSSNPEIKRWASKAFYLWFPQNADRKGCGW